MKVKIVEIADELEMIFDEESSFYNTDDGTVYIVSNEEMSAAEEEDELENCILRDWQIEDTQSITKYANNRKIWLNLREGFPHPYTIVSLFILKR